MNVLVPSVEPTQSVQIGGPGADVIQDMPVPGMVTVNIKAATGIQPFTLDASSTALVAGNAFCLLPGQVSGTLVTKATPSALASAGVIAGIALGPVVPGTSFQGATGAIANSISGLGPSSPAGLTMNVTVDSTTANLLRIVVPSGISTYKAPFDIGGNMIAGVADPHGNVTLLTQQVVTTGAKKGFNLATFVGSDCGSGLVDEAPGWDAAMTAITLASSGTFTPPFDFLNAKADLFIPPGAHSFSRQIFIWHSCHVWGIPAGRYAGGYENAGAPATSLLWPKGVGGFFVPTETTSIPANPGGPATQGYRSVLENLFCFGGYQGVPNGGPPRWLSGTPVTAGDIIRFTWPNPHGYAYKARNGGTMGATQPRPADAWPVPPPTYSVVDNGVTWDLIQADGIMMGLAITMRNMAFYGFAGNGISIPSDTPTGFVPDCYYVDNCESFYNGGSGLLAEGNDANAGISTKLFSRYNGEWAIRDTAVLGNLHLVPHSANAVGAGGYYFRNCTGIELYSEAGDGPLILSGEGGVALGGHYGDGMMSNDYAPDWPGAGQAVATGAIIKHIPSGTWTALTHYTSAQHVQPTVPNGLWYTMIETTGNSGALEPAIWPTTIGLTVSDGSCTWMCMGGPMYFYATNTGVTGGSLPNFSVDQHGRCICRNGTALPGDPRNVVDNTVEWALYGFSLGQSFGLLLGKASGAASPRAMEVINKLGAIQLICGLGNVSDPEVVNYVQAADDPNNPLQNRYDQSFDPHRWARQLGGSPTRRVDSVSVAGAAEGPAQPSDHSKSRHWTNLIRIDEHEYRGEVVTTDATANVPIPICDLYATPTNGYATTAGTVVTMQAKIVAQAVGGTDFAQFIADGQWINAGGVLTPSPGTPEVIAGEPTDGNRCSAGATTWRGTVGVVTGADVGPLVTGQVGVDIQWSCIVTITVSH